MSSLFSSDKEGNENRMDLQMRRGLLETETISAANTLIVHIVRERRGVPIFSSIRSCYELGSCERRRRSSVSNILHEQDPARCRDQVPAIGEIDICSCSGCSKAKTILPSIPRLGNNKPTTATNTTQNGCFWSASEIGNRAE